ncbi:HNH endonuclease [Vibrio splendidus]|uniref:HNH endonuclease n=1 Tax=Vibrio splendidus TaxID=29497 RepID=UPI001E5E8387|nr:HNH endonuclease signature motif containing protein [Vibrio splendidus]MCC4861776.1 HNH endonuclease [Vibrio splendidus]
MDSGIIVYWAESQEIIKFDYGNLDSIKSVTTSSELWDSGEKYEYSIEPKLKYLTDGSVEVTIKYESSSNTHINANEVCWGLSKLILNQKQNSGEARWVDSNEPKQNGLCRWVRLDAPLCSSERRKITSTKLQREQFRFRKLLMKFDGRCVLTGEENPTVLEAAHIIPVSSGGPDIPANGMILRCDLHKLYDSGAFKFDSAGYIQISSLECGNYYEELLNNTKLPTLTVERVRRALVEKEA